MAAAEGIEGASSGEIEIAMNAQDLTQIVMEATSGGDGRGKAVDRVFAVVYEELRAMAQREMSRERSDHTLQPTALVNEVYLRLVEDARLDWESRAHFFGIAARAMRQVLIDHARRRNRAKRGGGWDRVRVDISQLLSRNHDVSAVEMAETLDRLRALDERSATVVELRVFAGLTGAEIAAVLGVSRKTVVSDWRVARMWLGAEFADAGVP